MVQPSIAALGSGVISAIIAALMGRMLGLTSIVLIAVIVVSALGGAWFGYRSQQQQQ